MGRVCALFDVAGFHVLNLRFCQMGDPEELKVDRHAPNIPQSPNMLSLCRFRVLSFF